ncbi:putative glycolipid-binding domain-containing protein [Micromonospora sp. ALFpr18c]|uniref:putative glycolipid-binding domain-containing protein n=1 Tax=unclassified Micromonospora TaxID=2617518 RepID=UPI00124B0485|nr:MULTISPECIES: putative glycolipid-binding domain-containing protein [unclassified Micromonospora]KAB1944132.1 putative glycolipid-binding domain-containing protein [Micromonospora sp. ALFpr18c]MDG4760835.1 putative glycolipid-binding domain-containing protein [Micromonospora sp. WMMD710]
MPKSLFWSRTDTAGSEQALLDDGNGLAARGTLLAVDPIPWTARYQLTTAPDWSTTRVEVEAEGSGWLRRVTLERATGRWRVTTAEQGDLDAALIAAGHPRAGLPGTDDPDRLADALDVDLSGSPLFNALPFHRLGMAAQAADMPRRITVAWVLLPGLEVVAAEQIYTGLGPGRVRFASGTFTADIDVDADGYVVRYPGLAERIDPR